MNSENIELSNKNNDRSYNGNYKIGLIVFIVFSIVLIILLGYFSVSLNRIINVMKSSNYIESNTYDNSEKIVTWNQVADGDIEVTILSTGEVYHPWQVAIKNKICYLRINISEPRDIIVVDISNCILKVNERVIIDNLI